MTRRRGTEPPDMSNRGPSPEEVRAAPWGASSPVGKEAEAS